MKVNLEFNPLDVIETGMALKMLLSTQDSIPAAKPAETPAAKPTTVPAVKPAETPKPVAKPAAPEAKPGKMPDKGKLTLDSLKSKTSTKIQEGYKNEIKQKLTELNSSNVSSLPEDKWDEFDAFLETLKDG